MADFLSPHVRWNPLRGEWVLVSPQRNARPWQGQIERTADPDVPTYDPLCCLCPCRRRAGGDVSPDDVEIFGKSRRGDGREPSASARPDLGDRDGAQRAGARTGGAAQVHGGFELLGTAQRDMTPEAAAARLRLLSEEHYRDR
jgi:galactose-1-phosphate uridylyltransferase